MPRASREHILNEVRRLGNLNAGVSLGKKRFEAESGIAEAVWLGRYWARWSDLVRDAGLEPNAWQGKNYDDAMLTRQLAEIVRSLGHFPTMAELRMRRQAHPDCPNDKVFSNRFGSKAEQVAQVLAWSGAEPAYADVAAICRAVSPKHRHSPASDAVKVVTGAVYLIRMGEFHKIGKTNDPGRRAYELGLRLPERHDVLHIIETDDPSGIEAYWHRRFASQRANGEWFRLSAPDVDAFRRRTYM